MSTMDLQITSYYLEQQIYSIVSQNLHYSSPLLLALLVISGILTNTNPCFITIIPLSVSYIYSQKNKNIKLVLFAIGLFTSSLILTSSIYYINHQYNWLIKSLPILSSAIMIIYGLLLLQIWNIDILPIKLQKLISSSNYNNFIIGILVGLTSTPCSTPIMATILFWISSTSSLSLGFIYILFYIIGLMTPLAILSLIIQNQLFSFLILNQIWSYTVPCGGCIMLGLGIFSFLNKVFV